jgi:hypothetical protein
MKPTYTVQDLKPWVVEERVQALPNIGNVTCSLHAYHSPEVVSFDVHHIWPQGEGGPDVPSNRAIVCPTGHRNVHTLIRLMLLYGPEPINENAWGKTTWAMALAGYGKIKR